MLSHLNTELLRVLPPRPLASVGVSADGYSIGYSVTWRYV
jgi:hypothetical protein